VDLAVAPDTKNMLNILKNMAYRFLFNMSFNNPAILNIYEKNRKIFEADLDSSLIAGQLWIEVLRHDYNLLSDKEN
jgi:hypothetical protein